MENRKQYPMVVFLMIIIVGYFNPSFAEDERQPYYPTIKNSKEKEVCIKNFDINNLDFSRHTKVSEKMDTSNLTQYFGCRAVAKNNIAECNRLPSSTDVETCQYYFNEYYGTYGNLAMAGHVTPQVLDRFKNVTRMTIEAARAFTEAWLKDDLSFCETLSNPKESKQCKAMISGDSRFCLQGDRSCINRSIYIKALKSGDIKKCEEMQGANSEIVKLICQVTIGGDEKLCDRSSGFKDFVDKYCE